MTPDQFGIYFHKLDAKQQAALGTMAAGIAGMRYVAATVDIAAVAETFAGWMEAALAIAL